METEKGEIILNIFKLRLEAVNYLLNMCISYSGDLNAHGWYHILRSLDRELWTVIKDKDTRKRIESLLQTSANLLNRANQINDRTGRNAIPIPLYNELDSLEKIFRDGADQLVLHYKKISANNPELIIDK